MKPQMNADKRRCSQSLSIHFTRFYLCSSAFICGYPLLRKRIAGISFAHNSPCGLRDSQNQGIMKPQMDTDKRRCSQSLSIHFTRFYLCSSAFICPPGEPLLLRNSPSGYKPKFLSYPIPTAILGGGKVGGRGILVLAVMILSTM